MAKTKTFQYKKLTSLKEKTPKDLHHLHEQHINTLIEDAEEYLGQMEISKEEGDNAGAKMMHEFAAGIIHALDLFIVLLKKQTNPEVAITLTPTEHEVLKRLLAQAIPMYYSTPEIIELEESDDYSEAVRTLYKKINPS